MRAKISKEDIAIKAMAEIIGNTNGYLDSFEVARKSVEIADYMIANLETENTNNTFLLDEIEKLKQENTEVKQKLKNFKDSISNTHPGEWYDDYDIY